MSVAKTYSIPSLDPAVEPSGFRIEYPDLPASIDFVLKMIARPTHIDTNTLIRLIESDRDTSNRLYSIASSHYFGSGRRIDMPGRLILTLGPTTVGGLIIACDLVHFAATMESPVRQQLERVVEHSASVAFHSRHIANMIHSSPGGGQKLAPQHVSECFASAILHELGRIILLCNKPKAALKLYDSLSGSESYTDILNAETSGFGCNSSTVGVDFARILGFPDVVTDVIRHHETDADFRYPENSVECRMIRATKCAHEVAAQLGYSFPAVAQAPDAETEAESDQPEAQVWTELLKHDLPEETVDSIQSAVKEVTPQHLDFLHRLLET